MALANIGLGSNLGDPVAYVEAGLAALGEIGTVRARSSLYRTQPWGVRDQPAFVNAVARVDVDLAPRELLRALKDLETRLGRRPGGERWGPRAIDFDILTYADAVIDEPDLQIPHPLLHERAFVLVPLAEIDRVYETARDAISALDLAGVRKIERD